MPKLEFFYDRYRRHRANDMWGNTILHRAVLFDHAINATMPEQIEAINVRDQWSSSQSTPIMLACKMGKTNLVKQLAEAGADVNKDDYIGFTPLHYACIYRDTDMITSLLEHGADPLATNCYGATPLRYYLADITTDELCYPHGYTKSGSLTPAFDHDESYRGTRCKDYSALRWFVQDMLENANPRYRARSENVVYNCGRYENLLIDFCNLRKQRFSNETINKLIKRQAENLRTQYKKRLSCCLFIGFITRKHLERKLYIVNAIVNGDQLDPALKTDGRTQALLTHYQTLYSQKNYDKIRGASDTTPTKGTST